MNILLISQCRHNALKETRRVLDQFAERCGERTWQTAITQAGLETLHKMLRQTARKNTAVACFLTRGKNHTELLWRVGDRSRFNDQGRVPTNRTRRNILRADDENTWTYAHSIQIMSVLAALLHDIGKANLGFQAKIHPEQTASRQSDPYRHEWLSLRLFQAMIADCADDEAWLRRLANWGDYSRQHPDWHQRVINDSQAGEYDFSVYPPLAQWLMWLIVTHHRLPFYPDTAWIKPGEHKNWQSKEQEFNRSMKSWYRYKLRPVEAWMTLPSQQMLSYKQGIKKFWQFRQHITDSSLKWQKAVQRWANKALQHPPLMALSRAEKPIADPLLLQLSRVCLQVGDHHVSSQPPQALYQSDESTLFANTYQDKAKGITRYRQTLDEHLLGVANQSAYFARLLPKLPQLLPAITAPALQRRFRRPTPIPRFQWQNRAYALSSDIRESTRNHGFFGINMAGTGCGKTLGNVRIMHALSDPERGMRLTIALGLRVLTLQTGQALRERLHLREEDLAILVGGGAMRQLFELNQTPDELHDIDPTEASGSESAQALLDQDEYIDGGFSDNEIALGEDTLGPMMADGKARQLLHAPIISCTIDHIMRASEGLKGGRHIVPMLRLLSSDLILDEPDDFGQADLPALSRLVHWAGLLGSRVLLSSATLTPDFVTGLMRAYHAGRNIWQQHQGLPEDAALRCAWFDEYGAHTALCQDAAQFSQEHQQVATQRAARLHASPVRRRADVLPVASLSDQNDAPLARTLIDGALQLHRRYGSTDPDSGNTLSIGLIRLANIKHIIPLAQTMLQASLPADTCIHLCCYHARQLLMLRSHLENTLDRLLARHEPQALFRQPEIMAAMRDHPAAHHLFIILGSPVTEVGRDHDYDWAIAEPSSMRSLIQLCGRVWRHRPEKIAEHSNILILESNLNALSHPNLNLGKAVFCRPGFEKEPNFLLKTHRITELIAPESLHHITAAERIVVPEVLQAQTRLADLEHAVMQSLMNPRENNFVTAYWQPDNANRAISHCQRISPFRTGEKSEDYVCLPAEDADTPFYFKTSHNAWRYPNDETGEENHLCRYTPITGHGAVRPWLHGSYVDVLETLSHKTGYDLAQTALRFATVSLPTHQRPASGWRFNEWLGFW
ncbi:MAG: type I-F CRISPR-associated helicase Cas3f [Neisseria sp.]|nr:type I-F CRISPR-associated helicase Cas3f [Neisseria sp.]